MDAPSMQSKDQKQATVLIVYASTWGSTEKLAQQVAKGAESVSNTLALPRKADEVTIEEVAAADGLIIGTPVHMGSPDWRIKKFIDEICSKLWMKDKMNGKVGAVFASGGGFGSAGGGCELTMLALMNNLAELGLLLLPLPKNTPGYNVAGLQWGPYGRSMGVNMEQTGLRDEQLEVFYHHGRHVARVSHLLKEQKIFS